MGRIPLLRPYGYISNIPSRAYCFTSHLGVSSKGFASCDILSHVALAGPAESSRAESYCCMPLRV